jgi:putative hydrolase of the HAD superfamily
MAEAPSASEQRSGCSAPSHHKEWAMLRDRAVLFDLDDTLHPLRLFVQSGFAAVATHLQLAMGIDRHDALEMLKDAATGPNRGRELQVLIAGFGLPPSILPHLVQLIRDHTPAIHLPPHSVRTLQMLRPHWRLGIVTNGLPAVQRRKVEALGLVDAVDTIVYAAEHGARGGKPERAPFMAALRALGVTADRTVFVGDDEWCDLVGATRVGMRTVFLRAAEHADPSFHADAIVHTLLDLPRVADALVPAQWRQCVA